MFTAVFSLVALWALARGVSWTRQQTNEGETEEIDIEVVVRGPELLTIAACGVLIAMVNISP
jgi:hypothetical protein